MLVVVIWQCICLAVTVVPDRIFIGASVSGTEHCGISVVETSGASSSGPSVFTVRPWKGNESTESKDGLSVLGFGVSNLTKGFCSLVLALSPSQSSLDQSDWSSKG